MDVGLLTVTVVVTVFALARDEPIVWVSYVPLLPLALPYAAKRRHARRGLDAVS